MAITVQVPDEYVEEFYARFGEFLADHRSHQAPTQLGSGTVPAWVVYEDAETTASALWGEISLAGRAVLTHLYQQVTDQTVFVRPIDLATETGHPGGVSGIAGVLGEVGRSIRRAGLPMYKTPGGDEWHYLWGWDGERYSMTPEVAHLLRKASNSDR